MKIKLLVSIFFLISYLAVEAQITDYGIVVNTGLGSNDFRYRGFGDTEYDSKRKLSGNLGLVFYHEVNRNSKFGLGFLLVFLNSENNKYRGLTGYIVNSSNSFNAGFSNEVFEYKMNYAAFPIIHIFTLGKVEVMTGLQPMFLSSGFSKRTFSSQVIFSPLKNETVIYDTSTFNKWDVGIKLGLGYKLPKNLNLRLEWYVGLHELTENDELIIGSSNRQATLGLQYSLKKKNSNSEQ